MTDRMTISQNLTALRKDRGLTQSDVADRLHVSHQAISQWERGDTLPDILTLPALSALFGVSVDHLLGIENEKTDPVENLPLWETIENGTTPATPGSAWATVEAEGDYAVVLLKDGEPIQRLPTDLQDRLILVLHGNCRDLTTSMTTAIHGDVLGDATISGGASIGGGVGNSAIVSGGANLQGGVRGDVACSGGCQLSGGVIGDVTLSGTCTIEDGVEGNVTTDHDLTISGDVHGNITTSSSDLSMGDKVKVSIQSKQNENISIGGNVTGNIDCGNLSVGGDIEGDVDCGSLSVGGDINGDIDCGPLSVGGDINGDVDCGSLRVEGNISGDVDCGSCNVEGDVDGDIDASGNVTVHGSVHGEIDSDDEEEDDEDEDDDFGVDVDVDIDR